jgi:hypothetical protein
MNNLVDIIDIKTPPIIDIIDLPVLNINSVKPDKDGFINVYWTISKGNTFSVGNFGKPDYEGSLQKYIYPGTFTFPNELIHVLARNDNTATIKTTKHNYRIIPTSGIDGLLDMDIEYYPHFLVIGSMFTNINPRTILRNTALDAINTILDRANDPVGYADKYSEYLIDIFNKSKNKIDSGTKIILAKGELNLSDNEQAIFNWNSMYDIIKISLPTINIFEGFNFDLDEKPKMGHPFYDLSKPIIFYQCVTSSCIYGLDKFLESDLNLN